MNILVINAGSSSLKYQLINMENEVALAKGLCERIGIEGSNIQHKDQEDNKTVINIALKEHKDAITEVVKILTDNQLGPINDMSEIAAVGHRVVNGGEKFYESVIINDEVILAIEKCIDLAPLHNPPNITGITACQEVMPNTPMVAVFDTAFHQSMPKHAYRYAIPNALYKKYGIRKYGFHGTSHKYVAYKAAEILNMPVEEAKIITCHLGNGSSICAVDGGKSVDTSMGLTPLDGLAMGTRSGSLDPAVVPFLMEKANMTAAEVVSVLNKESGVLGISEISSDFRDLHEATMAGNEKAKLALDIFAYRVKKYIGEYSAAMNGVDAVVLTAGIGENNMYIRELICKDLERFGITIDESKNDFRGEERIITTDDSKIKVIVIPTDEELAIARATKLLV